MISCPDESDYQDPLKYESYNSLKENGQENQCTNESLGYIPKSSESKQKSI